MSNSFNVLIILFERGQSRVIVLTPRGRTRPFVIFIIRRPPRSLYVSNYDKSFITWLNALVSYNHLFRPKLKVISKIRFLRDGEVVEWPWDKWLPWSVGDINEVIELTYVTNPKTECLSSLSSSFNIWLFLSFDLSFYLTNLLKWSHFFLFFSSHSLHFFSLRAK
jgi:hypothetical protein